MLLSSSQDSQQLNGADLPVEFPGLPNSHYEPLLTPPMHPSKETSDFFSETLFNGVCKENQPTLQNFIQASSGLSQNDNVGFQCSDGSVSGYGGQVPLSFHSPAIERRPSPGPFGVLPHEAVMTRPNRYERNKEKFITPVSKNVSASYNSGPYADRDVNSIYSPAPLSAQSSAFSGDNASLSPIVNSVTSPTISNFSSPSDYYSSPKQNFGAYNSLQSPVPQSPSVAQHSYPSSPFTSVDVVPHVQTAPPCSPMGGSPYINNLNQVPQRNGLKPQQSPSNSVGNNVMCFNTPQTPNVVHHGSVPVLPKTPDYHSDYGAYRVHDQNVSPSSFTSVYTPPMHPSQMSMGNNTGLSQPHSQHLNSIHHDSRMAFGHSIQPALTSPTYNVQNKINHDTTYGACSSNNISSGQSMQSSRYPSCSTPLNPISSGINTNLPPGMTSHDSQYGYQPPDIVDDKNALDMFNSHVDSGVHNPDSSSNITNFLESELPILEREVPNNRQVQPMELQESNQTCAMTRSVGNSIRIPTPIPPILNSQSDDVPQQLNNFYNLNLDVARPGNFSLNSYPRRRGRRGRRRKATINHSGDFSQYQCDQKIKKEPNAFDIGFPMAPSKILEYENIDNNNSTSKRICDMKELPPNNYSLSRYRTELKMSDNQKKITETESNPKKKFVSLEDDLKYLNELNFPPADDEKDTAEFHMYMNKNKSKNPYTFLNRFKEFLAQSNPAPNLKPEIKLEESRKKSKDKHKSHRSHKPTFILRMGRCNKPGEWVLKETHISPIRISDSDESASTDSVDVLSSHKIKQEIEDYEVEKTGNSSKVSDRLSNHSAKKTHHDSIDHSDKYNDLKGNNLHLTNHETLPAGILKIKTEILDDVPSTPSCTEHPYVPKKRGRKAKNATTTKVQAKINKQSSEAPNPTNDFPIIIKQEPIDDVQYEYPRRVLRSRKEDAAVKEIPSSIDDETIDISSDELDDSDNDPDYKIAGKQKSSDSLRGQMKSTSGEPSEKKTVRRRQPRKNSATSPAGRKKILKAAEPTPKRRGPPKKTASSRPRSNVPFEIDVKIKKEKAPEHFVIAKTDLDQKTPYIWKVDRDTNMLQRFDAFTNNDGVMLHRNSYTYAAWNEMSVHNYLKINVKILSRSHVLCVVQYLGVEGEEAVAESSNQANNPDAVKKENFEIFLQSLISQALDPSFLHEITNENDEYFLSSLREIERITKKKKSSLIKNAWEEELKKSAETFPCVNILNSIVNDIKCQVCHVAKGSKLLQFYGQPYDYNNLGSLEAPLSIKTQFNVCNMCSNTVTLYSRLHHQKYNHFIECRAKLNQVKSDKESSVSHALLELCLQDHQWVNSMFLELVTMCKDCDTNS